MCSIPSSLVIGIVGAGSDSLPAILS